MTIIKRPEKKKLAKKTITNAMVSIYNGKYCKDKEIQLEFHSYKNGGFQTRLKRYRYNLIINIYQNGEISYQHTIQSNADQKIKISEESLEYDDNEIKQSLKNMIKDIKIKIKNI